MTGSTRTSIGGRELTVTNLDKVLYPATGTTKADVLAYVLAVEHVLLPWVRDRPVTRIRWPDGVEEASFFEKGAPRGTPEWVPTVVQHHNGSRSGRGARDVAYPLVDEPAALAWLAQSGALELHVPQWRVDRATGVPLAPDRLVVDLDPGAPAGLDECAEVALAVRRALAGQGWETTPVLSGSQGLQIYADVATVGATGRRVLDRAGSTLEYARALALALEEGLPALVVSRMAKELRPGKVLVDWSQNNVAKTTIAPWSLRGRSRPRAAVPITWDEVEAGGLRQLEIDEALARLAGAAG